jgi:hypothetical protein
MRLTQSQDGSVSINHEIESRPRPDLPPAGIARIGFLDWGRLDGAFGRQYKPESFDLIEASSTSSSGGSVSGNIIEVQLRGVLVVDKQIQKGIAELLPNDYPIKASDLRPNRYEFLVLEVLRARLLEKNP